MDFLQAIAGSTQSKILLGLSLLSLVVSNIVHFSAVSVVLQLLVYMFLAYQTNCLVMGGCQTLSWLSIILPVLIAVIHIVVVVRSRQEPFHAEADQDAAQAH